MYQQVKYWHVLQNTQLDNQAVFQRVSYVHSVVHAVILSKIVHCVKYRNFT